MKIRCSGNNFVQINDCGELIYEKIYQILKEIIVKENFPKKIIFFDFFCGVGSLSILIKKKLFEEENFYDKIEILGVDRKESILDAKFNLQTNFSSISTNQNKNEKLIEINFLDFDLMNNHNLSSFFPPFLENFPFKIIFVNPGRSGLTRSTCFSILEMDFDYLFFVSCKQNSFFDNCLILYEKYEFHQFCLIDNFPQTINYESITVLKKK